MRYKLAGAAGYAAILGWLAYHTNDIPDTVGYAIWFVLPFVAGLVAGPWAALALPVAVVIAVPAGYGDGEAEIPIWFAMMFVGLIAVPEIVVGWGTRWFATWYARR